MLEVELWSCTRAALGKHESTAPILTNGQDKSMGSFEKHLPEYFSDFHGKVHEVRHFG